MPEFESWSSYLSFKISTKSFNRYFHNGSDQDFLETVLATSKSRLLDMPQGTTCWRSQLDYAMEPFSSGSPTIPDIKVPCPVDNDRMKPLLDKAKEGRANPKGIPYLYVATDKGTAMAEARPWLGSLISLGKFKINRDITVVDCTKDDAMIHQYYIQEPEKEKWEEIVWSEINKAFSEPVTPSDNVADYIPTQILAELFRNNGFNGIACKSSLGEGNNIVLFDTNIADIEERFLYRVSEVNFAFRDARFPLPFQHEKEIRTSSKTQSL